MQRGDKLRAFYFVDEASLEAVRFMWVVFESAAIHVETQGLEKSLRNRKLLRAEALFAACRPQSPPIDFAQFKRRFASVKAPCGPSEADRTG